MYGHSRNEYFTLYLKVFMNLFEQSLKTRQREFKASFYRQKMYVHDTPIDQTHTNIPHERPGFVSRSSRDRLGIVSGSSRDRLGIVSRLSRDPLEVLSISSLDLLEIIFKSIWYHLSTHTQHTHTSRTHLEIVSGSSRDRLEIVSRSSRDHLEIISGSSREHVTTNTRALTHSSLRTHTHASIYISYLYIVFKIILSRKVVPMGIKIRKGHGNFEDRISC